MARAQKVVDKMLRPHIERYERQQEELQRNHHKYYTTLPEIMVRQYTNDNKSAIKLNSSRGWIQLNFVSCKQL